MTTKTLTITEEAYDRLAMHKEAKDSFTDVILKLTSKHNILELAGLLSAAEADALEESIMEERKRFEKSIKERIKDL